MIPNAEFLNSILHKEFAYSCHDKNIHINSQKEFIDSPHIWIAYAKNNPGLFDENNDKFYEDHKNYTDYMSDISEEINKFINTNMHSKNEKEDDDISDLIDTFFHDELYYDFIKKNAENDQYCDYCDFINEFFKHENKKICQDIKEGLKDYINIYANTYEEAEEINKLIDVFFECEVTKIPVSITRHNKNEITVLVDTHLGLKEMMGQNVVSIDYDLHSFVIICTKKPQELF